MISEIIARLKSVTPVFFQRIQIFGGSLVALCTSLQALPHISDSLNVISINGIVAGTVIVLVGQLACTNAPGKPTIIDIEAAKKILKDAGEL